MEKALGSLAMPRLKSFFTYLDRLRQQVTDQWPHQEVNSFEQTIVVFSISRDGQLTNLGISQSSGSMPIDAAALGAVQKAAPFEPLPESLPGNHYPIRFKFTINALGQLNLH